ncbi:hypothetical protein AGMMS49944_27580 [Spirochaetia bacterium]|nr:hypothetical protein AGMMS49944_27580 [Spirochaetia bacterium]
MTIEQTLTIPEETKHLTVDLPEPVPAGTATFRLELEDEERERLRNLDTPLRRKYPTLISMIGSCKGLDTMDEYFARKKAEKDMPPLPVNLSP